jgi:hypothetical protein
MSYAAGNVWPRDALDSRFSYPFSLPNRQKPRPTHSPGRGFFTGPSSGKPRASVDRGASPTRGTIRFTRTAIVGTLTALMIPATIMLAETSPPTRPAGPISVELAKKCRDLALKANPKPAGNAPYKQAQREFYENCIAKGGNVPE